MSTMVAPAFASASTARSTCASDRGGRLTRAVVGERRDAQPRHVDLGDRPERHVDHARIEAVATRDHAERELEIVDAPSERPDLGAAVVQGSDARKWPVFGNSACGRLQARDAAPGRGEPDAPATVAPDAERRRAGGDQCAFAAAARAGTARVVVRIARDAVELVAVAGRGLGDHDRAGRAQPRHHRRIFRGSPVAMARSRRRTGSRQRRSSPSR